MNSLLAVSSDVSDCTLRDKKVRKKKDERHTLPDRGTDLLKRHIWHIVHTRRLAAQSVEAFHRTELSQANFSSRVCCFSEEQSQRLSPPTPHLSQSRHSCHPATSASPALQHVESLFLPSKQLMWIFSALDPQIWYQNFIVLLGRSMHKSQKLIQKTWDLNKRATISPESSNMTPKSAHLPRGCRDRVHKPFTEECWRF